MEKKEARNFIEAQIIKDKENNKNDGRVHTRFPPEPNGFLHIGHAKAICLNFGMAAKYDGLCNLRFDDTNPMKEEEKYERAIKKDIKWLGFDWEDRLFYASDYFDTLYDYAIKLIKDGKAFVCNLDAEEMREYRGTLTQPGKNSPYRDRSVEQNLELFEKMRNGEFADGACTLRAKIDMASPNINLRDPVMYRIKHIKHNRTGEKWCIYPSYDFTHGQSDSIEGVTHSLCDISFEDHRPLYDWFCENLEIHHPQQMEFARLNLTYTFTSKRKLKKLVDEKIVDGWDDPRLPTLSGLRRRGFTPESIRDFIDRVGVAKNEGIVDISLLNHCLREDMNKRSTRVMAVLDPVKVIITNYPEDKVEYFDAVNNPEDENSGTRKVPFSREIYIERNDFREEANRKYFRMKPGKEVRLKHAYYVKCEDFKKNENGEIEEIYCSYDPDTRGGWSDDGRKVKGTLHWVSVEHAIDAQVNIYDSLFTIEDPSSVPDDETFMDYLNPESKVVLTNCKCEPSLKDATQDDLFQFLRNGYYHLDDDSNENMLIFNQAVALRDKKKRKN